MLSHLRQPHFVCEEDCWYSCPLSGECCNDHDAGTACNCGADLHNQNVDRLALASDKLGWYLSAALEDSSVCQEMKTDIENWFDALNPPK